MLYGDYYEWKQEDALLVGFSCSISQIKLMGCRMLLAAFISWTNCFIPNVVQNAEYLRVKSDDEYYPTDVGLIAS
jgi:hypothetical protein